MLSLLFKYKSIIAVSLVIIGLIIAGKLYLNNVYESGVLNERNRILLENKDKQIEANKITSGIQIDLSKSIDKQKKELSDIESELNRVRLEEAKKEKKPEVLLSEDEVLAKLAEINIKTGKSPSYTKEVSEHPIQEISDIKVQYVLVPVEQNIEIAKAEIKALWDTFCIEDNVACK